MVIQTLEFDVISSGFECKVLSYLLCSFKSVGNQCSVILLLADIVMAQETQQLLGMLIFLLC